MLRCCGCVCLPLIIFVATHNLTLMETDSAKICLLYGKMCAIDATIVYVLCIVLCVSLLLIIDLLSGGETLLPP